MKNYSLYEKTYLEDKGFPLYVTRFFCDHYGPVFSAHWHEQLEMLFFLEGKGVIECEAKSIDVAAGDIIIVNTNELHCGYCTEGPLIYDYIAVDPSLIKGSFDGNCEQKYITPIAENLILFSNKISGSTTEVECIKGIASEYESKEPGFELSIKSYVYRLLVLLLRNHVDRVLTQKEYKLRTQNLARLNQVLEFIERNYMEKITIDQLTAITCLSRDHFSHLFKKLTGRSVNEYINGMRIDKAEMLIKNTDMNITEIAMATGFNDANYFSRIFRKYKKTPPSAAR